MTRPASGLALADPASGQCGAARVSQSLALVLVRSAAEAERLAAGLAGIEADIEGLIGEVDGAAARRLQEVDHLRQTAEGLGRFLAAIAASLDPAVACAVDQAVSGLGLRAQALRLSGLGQVAGPPSGEPELWSD